MKNQFVTVRKAVSEDAEAIHSVECECFDTPWSLDAFICEITENERAEYFVAEFHNQIVGYIGYWKILDEGHITNVAVSKKQRGMGLGKSLLSELIYDAKQNLIENITLECRESNYVALSLYESFGFVPCGKRRCYYTDNNEDAIIMWYKV